jgi:hypothetical protein
MTASTRPLSIALAAAGLLLSAHGAQAASTDADMARVDVVGQLSLRDACPDVDIRDLADQLAATWDDVAKPSNVEVAFKVQRHHVYEVQPATASQRTWHRIRHAVHGLPCDGGDDQPHAVRFVVRYIDVDGSGAAAILPADAGR